MDELGIGLASVQVVQVCVVDLVAGEEEASLLQEISATVVVNRATLQRIVNSRKMPATTVVRVAILPKTARSQRRRENNAATTVADLDIWPVIVIMLMSRNVIHVENLGIFRRTALKSSAIGMEQRTRLFCECALYSIVNFCLVIDDLF